MNLGMIIFYDNKTGEVLVNTGEYKDAKIKRTISQLIDIYEPLKQRSRDSFDYIELDYGQHKEEFSKMSGYRINTKDKSIIFSYEASDGTVVETDKPLIDKIVELQKELESTKDEVFATQNAIIELSDIMLGEMV